MARNSKTLLSFPKGNTRLSEYLHIKMSDIHDYKVITQRRLKQRGASKGQYYTIKKFQIATGKDKGKFVKKDVVLSAAKIREVRVVGKADDAKWTRVYIELDIKNYERRRDSQWGKAGTVAAHFIHYRSETTSEIKDEYDAFTYRQKSYGKSGRDNLKYSITHTMRGDPRYGNAEVEIKSIKFQSVSSIHGETDS